MEITPAGGPMKTRTIMRDGKPAGWIRPVRGGYMVKIYGAQWVSNGVTNGAMTDCQVVKTLAEAKTIIGEY